MQSTGRLLKIPSFVVLMATYKTALLWRYYDALLDYLQTYGYNDSLPTEKDFKDEVHRNYLKGLTAALETLPYRFEDDKDDPLEIAEEYAQESLDTNTTVLDSSGWNSKEFSEIMQIIVDDVFRTIQLRL
ncbi:hypothetical protein O3M35_001071 [Rhynocoris fuscipes]|uniref:Uncharacterized protein n=1 Tax=Rhynocoris fuscipes TaxID=488301 RepID=A0AAW1DTT6_9HEMI